MRLAYNWRSSYLSAIAGLRGQPTTVKAYGQLDFSSRYKVNDHVFLSLDATNLTVETIEKCQVYQNRETYAEPDGTTVTLGDSFLPLMH